MLHRVDSLFHDFKNASSNRILTCLPNIRLFYEYMQDVARHRTEMGLWPRSYFESAESSYKAANQLIALAAQEDSAAMTSLSDQLLRDYRGDLGAMSKSCVWPWSPTASKHPIVMALLQVTHIWLSTQYCRGFEVHFQRANGDQMGFEIIDSNKRRFRLPVRVNQRFLQDDLTGCVIVVTMGFLVKQNSDAGRRKIDAEQ